VKRRIAYLAILAVEIQKCFLNNWHVATVYSVCGSHVAMLYSICGSHVAMLYSICGSHVAMLYSICGSHDTCISDKSKALSILVSVESHAVMQLAFVHCLLLLTNKIKVLPWLMQ